MAPYGSVSTPLLDNALSPLSVTFQHMHIRRTPGEKCRPPVLGGPLRTGIALTGV